MKKYHQVFNSFNQPIRKKKKHFQHSITVIKCQHKGIFSKKEMGREHYIMIIDIVLKQVRQR